MSTNIRPELSEKNRYWIERDRFYELRHFCRQYRIWKKAFADLDGLMKLPPEALAGTMPGHIADPTARCAEAREYYAKRIALVEETARDTDPVIGSYILEGVVNGVSFDRLLALRNVPCGKERYYELYRRFFWLLDKRRG